MSAHIVEHLEVRLQREIPGARVVRTTALGPEKTWSVVDSDGALLASAYSQREACNKAMDAQSIKRVQR